MCSTAAFPLRLEQNRGYPATWSSAAINSGAGGGPSERDLASVTSGSLPNLRARILLNDLGTVTFVPYLAILMHRNLLYCAVPYVWEQYIYIYICCEQNHAN